MKITFEEPLTCPIIKENKFFPNITQEEIKFSQKLEKSPLRSRKKSFTGVFNEDYISKNSELKKLQREKSKRNIFDNEEARNSFASNNLAPVRIFLNAPNQKKKIAEIPELVSQEDKDEENLKQRKHSILSRKSENAEIYNSDKDLMAPLSAYQKKKRTKILKLEKEKISNTNKEDLNNNNKKFPFVCDDEDNKFSQVFF